MAGLGSITQGVTSQTGGSNIVEPQGAVEQGGGLGTPPPPKFEYQPNPSSELMRQRTIEQINQRADAQNQAALANRAAAERMQAQGGYAGHGNSPSVLAGGSNGGAAVNPNEGWTPSSPEAHQLNIALAEQIKSGAIDPQTAMSAIQSEDVSPEIKQVLASIVNSSSGSNGMEQGIPQGYSQGIPQDQGLGLGSIQG